MRLSAARPVSGALLSTAAVVLFALLAGSSLLVRPGLPDTAHGPLHLLQAQEWRSAWQLGTTRPLSLAGPSLHGGSQGWPDAGGSGPLLPTLTAALSLSGLPAQDALKVVLLIALIVGSIGVYLLARRFVSPIAAVTAAAAFALAPYRLLMLYHQGGYAQLLALALTPYALWGALRLSRGDAAAGIGGIAIGVGLLLLADPPTFVAFGPLLVAYSVRLLLAGTTSRRLALFAAATGGAALTAAPVWLPLLAAGAAPAEPNGVSAVAALTLRQLLALPQVLDGRALNPPYTLGLGGHLVLLAAPALALVGRSHPARAHGLFMFAALAAYCLALLAGVAPRLPAPTPAPSHLLAVALLPLALVVGVAAEALAGIRPKGLWPALACAALLAGSMPHLFPPRPFLDYSGLTPAALTAPPPAAGGTRLDAWWLDLDPAVALSRWTPHEAAFTVRAGADGPASLPLPHRPHLWLSVDGGQAEAARPAADGGVALSLEPGTHEVVLRRHEPWLSHFGGQLGLAGVVVVIAAIVHAPRRRPAAAPAAPASPALLGLAASLALLLAFKAAYLEGHTTVLRRHSPPGTAIEARYPLDIAFGGRVRLLGYDLQRNLPPQGEPLLLTLYWEALAPLDRDLEVTVDLASPIGGRVLAGSREVRPGDLHPAQWQPGYYVRDEHRVDLPPDLPAVSYVLRVSVRDARSGVPLPGPLGTGSVAIRDLQVLYHLPQDIRRFPGDRWYAFGDDIRLLGAGVDGQRAAPGDDIRVTLYWRAERPVAEAMKRYVRLVGADGNIVTQRDGWPVDGLYPTDRWLPQHIIADTVTLRVPHSAAPGRYQLAVGLHGANTPEEPPTLRRGDDDLIEGGAVLPGTIQVW